VIGDTQSFLNPQKLRTHAQLKRNAQGCAAERKLPVSYHPAARRAVRP
jgi:hypothetical protein